MCNYLLVQISILLKTSYFHVNKGLTNVPIVRVPLANGLLNRTELKHDQHAQPGNTRKKVLISTALTDAIVHSQSLKNVLYPAYKRVVSFRVMVKVKRFSSIYPKD